MCLARTNSPTSQRFESLRELSAALDEIGNQRNLEHRLDDYLVLAKEAPYRCGCTGCMPVLEGYDRHKYWELVRPGEELSFPETSGSSRVESRLEKNQGEEAFFG